MAGSLNKAQLIGHLGRDPEIRHARDGRAIANFSIATSESWRDKTTGERRERTEWHRIVIFNEGLVGVAEKYLKKGAKVFVEGQIMTRQWEGQDGQERWTTEIVLQGFGAQLLMLDRQQNGPGPGAALGAGDYGLDQVRAAWPVIGPKHADEQFFNFPHPHYHVDARFVSASLAARIGRYHLDAIDLAAQRYPFSEAFNYGPPQRLSAPVWRRRRCVDPDPPYHHYAVAPVRGLNAAFAGHQAKRGKPGWICPHRGAPLGSLAPDAHGVITCPLHGLRIDATTGRCVGPAETGEPRRGRAQREGDQ